MHVFDFADLAIGRGSGRHRHGNGAATGVLYLDGCEQLGVHHYRIGRKQHQQW